MGKGYRMKEGIQGSNKTPPSKQRKELVYVEKK
ncbi:uncharacterized protein G2W53_005817 [Senna tora]|uniref:Uncharacterized protein n=1 Tax=Senna tora TaxID=362788 RepID=A0A834X3C0_9FABA|nr:uncharacterized protein G2W53_005817 [Senna tora]